VSDGSSRRAALIESIYRIALEPQTYDSFMAEWAAYINQRVDYLQRLVEAGHTVLAESEEDPEITRHFEIAGRILAQMADRADPPAARGESAGAAPQLLADAEGRIVWGNTAAEREFGVGKGGCIDDLPTDAAHRRSLRQLCQRLRVGDPTMQPRPLLMKITSPLDGRSQFLQARMLPERDERDLILISRITPDWPEGVSRILAEDFGLSPSEAAICELVADGNPPEQIAALRGSAVATVRTQLKKIMAKTGSHSQVDLVRLLFSLMRMVERHPRAGMGGGGHEGIRLELPGGRTITAEYLGDPHGDPVIFFHGMLDGINLPPGLEKSLADAGFRLICPVRPWYGTAEPGDWPVPEYPDHFAAQVAALMDELHIPSALTLGHMGGALYAYALAQHFPDRVRGILAVAGAVPFTSVRDFAVMSTRQRLVAYTARYTPHLLPFVLRAGINQMLNGGHRRFMLSQYEGTADDMAAVNDPDIFERIASGHRFSVRQGHRAFEIDSLHMVSDWSHRVDATDVPLHVVHGDRDPWMNIDTTRDFWQARPGRAHLTVLDGGGQLILYRRPERILKALVDLRRDAARRAGR